MPREDGSASLAAILEQLLAASPPPECAPALETELGRLRRGEVNVMMVGHFKRGKSTLLNALLGRHVLPVGVVPVTALVTVVRPAAADAVRVSFLDGRNERWELGRLGEAVSEERNPGNVLGVDSVAVELADAAVPGGVVLADTPGSGSAFRHNTEVLRRALGRIDAAVFVLSADPPVGERELALLREVHGAAGEVLVVLNKVDRLDAEERAQALAYTCRAVAPVLGGEARVVPCSARRAAEVGLAGTGVEAVAAWLEGLGEARGAAVLARASARRVLRLLGQEAALLRMERAALSRSNEELAAAAAAVERTGEELGRTLDDVEAAFGACCARLMTAYDGAARELAPAAERDLERSLAGEARTLTAQGRSTRRFARDLEAARDRLVIDTLSAFQQERETAVRAGFAACSERALDGVNALVDEAFARTAASLGVEVESFDVREGFSMRSRLLYRVGMPRLTLDAIAEGLTLLLPPPLARRAVLRRHTRLLPSAVDRQLGLIRADLHERVNESAISFRAALRPRVAEAVDRLRGALARARTALEAAGAQRRQRDEMLGARLRGVEAALAEVREIAA